MADNIFARSPVEIATARADARTRGILDVIEKPKAPPAPAGAPDFDALARAHQVPSNVIAAVTEAAGIEDPAQAGQFADQFAAALGGRIAGGMSVKDAMKQTFPEGVDTDAILQRAVDMAQTQAPDGGAEAGEDGRSVAADLGRRAGSSIVRGVGSVLEGMGRSFDRTKYESDIEIGADGIARPVNTRVKEGPSEMVQNSRAAADAIRGYGDSIAEGISERGQQAMQDSMFEGDLFRPSTWKMPKDASAEGIAHLAVEVLGSMAPVVVASIITRSPVVAAAAGGAQSAGFGSEAAREVISEAAADVDANGVSRLERESPYYQSLIAKGRTPEEALALTSEAAQKSAAALAAIPGALGGAATGRLLQRPLAALAGRGIATRVGGHAALGALEEGAQEVGETVAGRLGMEQATGMDLDLTEGTLNDFVLGALGGAPVGAIGGARVEKDDPKDDETPQDAPDGPGAGPDTGPDAGMDPQGPTDPSGPIAPAGPSATAPEILDHAQQRLNELDRAATDTRQATSVGGAEVQVGQPGRILNADERMERDFLRANIDNPEALAKGYGVHLTPEGAEPTGPIGAAAALAPDAPEPIAPIAGNQPKGAKARITIPGGNPIEAEFQEETEAGITFTANGSPFFIPRDEIESGAVQVEAIDPLSEARREVEANAVENIPDPEISPYSDQILFDVTTSINNDIEFAKRNNGGSMRGIDVSNPANAEALTVGATAALNGEQAVPQFYDATPEQEQAAQIGFDLARNRAETARAPQPTGRPLSQMSQVSQPQQTGSTRKPTLQKRPFTNAIKASTGGIDPDGPLGAELKHRGVTPTTAPGLFRRGGAQSLDNLPASEWGDYAAFTGDDGNGYLDEQGIIEALAEEQAGNPVQDSEQMQLQAEADARAEIEEMRAQGIEVDEAGAETIAPEQAEVERIIPPRSELDDFTLGEDRAAMIRRDIFDAEAEIGVTLTPQERAVIETRLDADGGSVEDALWSILEKEPEADAETDPSDQAVQDPGPPLFEHELSQQGGTAGAGPGVEGAKRPAGQPGGEGQGQPRLEATEGAGSEAHEPVDAPEVAGSVAPSAQPAAAPVDRPAGFTFKLADRLDKSDQRALAKYRDSTVGKLIGELDSVVRRAEAQMRRKGHDVRDFDMRGQDKDGNWNQEASVIGEAEVLTRELLKEARKQKTGDLPYPARDEATGDFESDGTPVGYALEWLENVESMGLSVDQVDESAGTGEGAAPEMAESEIFPPVKETVSLMKQAKADGQIGFEEAQERVARWKQVAADIGKTGENAGKVVISLFDYTGAWSQPWQDAGYEVVRHDIKHGSDVLMDAFVYDRIREYREAGMEIVGVLSACPCTTFAGSGARWWQDLHNVESPEAVAKVFGDDAVLTGAKSPVEYNKMLYEATRDVIRAAAPTRFHVLENPIGRIQEVTGLTKPTARFHPHNFGDPYTKNTQLFGPMQTDLPFAEVDPVEGSKMQAKLRGNDPLGKEQRSTTPEGFAYAFFMANDPAARKLKDEDAAPAQSQAAEPATEQTPEGEQTLIPGVAPVTDKARAEAQMKKPKRGGAAPLPDGGLFDEGARDQMDMFAEPAPAPAPEPEQAPAPTGDGKGERLTTDLRQETMETVKKLAQAVAENGPVNDGDNTASFTEWSGEAHFGWGATKDGRSKKSLVLKRDDDGKWGILWATDRYGDRQLVHPRPGDKIAKEHVIAAHIAEAAEAFHEVIGDTPNKPRKTHKEWGGYKVGQIVEIPTRTIGASYIEAIYDMNTLAGTTKAVDVREWETGKVLRGVLVNEIGDVVREPDDAVDAESDLKSAGINAVRLSDGWSVVRDYGDGMFGLQSDRNGAIGIFSKDGDVFAQISETTVRPGKSGKTPEAISDELYGRPPENDQTAKAEIEAAAAETDPNPTQAQAEAENYKTGKTQWNGLTLSIENAKGSTRRGTDGDGKEWSVTMPAHYGRILRTEGADGDHVDFYMGDDPESDYVVIVNQVDPDTQEFDEHKVILGTMTRGAALDLYREGFSDGSGNDRIGSVSLYSVEGFKNWLKDGDLTDPTEPITMEYTKRKPKKPAKEAKPAAKGWRENKHLAQFKRNMRDPNNSLESMRTGVFPEVAEFADWLDSLSDADLDKIAPYFRPDYNPFHGATNLGNGGIEEAEAIFAAQGVTRKPTAQQPAEAAPFDPQPRGPRRIDWWWTNNSDKRRAALDAAGIKGVKASTWSEVSQDLAPEQHDALENAIFGPRAGDQKPVNKDKAEKPKGSAEYGAKNTLVSKDRAEELREKLKAKLRDQLNAGFDPEILAIGAELAAFHIEAGARGFVDLARSIAGDLGTTPDKLRPYLRGWYNGARDMMEDNGVSIDGMDDPDAVRAALNSGALDAAPEADTQPEPADDAPTTAEQEQSTSTAQVKTDREKITEGFSAAFKRGDRFATITQARKAAGEMIGRSVTEDDFKMVEEAIEAAVVTRARQIIADAREKRAPTDKRATMGKGPNSAEVYQELVDLYAAQPKLAQRTSTSIEQQAYSTPAPLAYLASRMAHIRARTTIYEPSAGNGMLMIEAADENIRANELNPDRHAQIARLYPDAKITNGDALQDNVAPRSKEVVIANPPFGKMKDADRNTVRFPMLDSDTTEIDHAISFKALDAMKDDGRAVLIVGGHQGDAARRREKYRTGQPRRFYKKLYDTYNVTEHFTVDGKLYERQGAGWPVDVIVIEGRKPSKKVYPMKEAPALYSSWEELRNRLNGQIDNLDPRGEREVSGDGPSQNAGETSDPDPLPLFAGGSDQPAGESGTGGGARPSGAGGTADVGVGSSQPVKGGRAGAPSGDGIGDDAQPGDGASDVPGQAGDDEGRPEGTGGDASGDTGGLPERPLPVKARTKPKRENTEAETAFQVQYEPRSAAQFAVGTLVPRNMQEAASRALDDLERRVGNIDAYVADKIGMSVDEMLGTETSRGAFSAEQVDALALAISNIEDGKGFIIGDQTGVGKGRINAGLIRYAIRHGKLPVFFTVKPGLYGDMIRDLRDIGEKNPESYVFMTNDGLRGGKSIPLSDDPADRMVSLTKSQNQKAIRDLTQTGKMPEGKKVVFTTYDQMNTVKKNVTDRMRAIQAIAPNAMFIMDESHEAGGTGGNKTPKPGDPEPRSTFIRGLLRASRNGAFFSSATFAKNPAVMSLYFKTNITEAAPLDKLEDIIERGGVPLQQIVSNQLVQDGQYLRRERTYEGIEMNLEQLPTDPLLAKDSATSLREIFQLDQNVMEDVRGAYIESNVKDEGLGAVNDGAVGDTGAGSTNFSSIMHNAVNQVLLAIKAESVVEKAIEAHKSGEKPIIALSNTNASIMEDYANEMGISVGDAFDIPFNEILRRYVQRLRRITLKNDDDEKEHITLTDDDVRTFGGEHALDELRRVEAFVDQVDFHGMPASPIDYIREKLEAAGIKTGEVTGRGKIIVNGVYQSRDSSAAANKGAMNAYNSGGLDALIINRSGATGFSLHATSDNDGKVRHMFILQPDPNIDTFMQMLGRINRTGQIKLPKYTIAVSDLAVEKRPAAVLMRKMASLNANTTASKKSAVSLDNVTDFLNRYGDEVVVDYLRENPELAAMTGIGIPKKKSEAAGIAAKFTGKLAILDPDRTAQIFDDIEALYTAYIAELDSMGQNALEAKALELDARTLHRTVVAEGTNPESAFGADTVLEDVDVKIIGKPMTLDQVDEQIEKVTGGKHQHDYAVDQARLIDDMAPAEREKLESSRPTLETRLAEAKTDKQKDKAQDAINRLDARLAAFDEKVEELKNIAHNFRPGRPVIVQMRGKGGETVDSVYGIALGIDLSKMNGSVTATSRANTRIALASPARELRVPASRFIGDDAVYELMNANESTVRRAFEDGQAEAREQRQIVTGNIIGGLEKFSRGQIVMFTRDDGSRDQGILMPKDFDARKSMEERPVTFQDLDHAVTFVDTAGFSHAPGMLKSEDGVFSVQRSYDGYIVKVKRKGGKPYILSPAARDLVGDFQSRSGDYKKTIGKGQLRELLGIYQDTLGTVFQAEDHKDEARTITGEALPDFGGDREMRSPDGWGEVEPDRRITDAEIDAIANEAQAELKASGLAGKVTAKIVRKVHRMTDKTAAVYRRGRGVIEVRADAASGPIETLRHEIVHALRDARYWGKDYGLFSKAEWQGLVREARKDKAALDDLRSRYPDLGTSALMEEAVAEMYRNWRSGRWTGTGPAATALGKVRAFFEALGNAMRGRGFQSAARTMQKIADGGVAGRGDPNPTGPGGGSPVREMRSKQGDFYRAGAVKARSVKAGTEQFMSDALTQAMAGKGGANLLALVPGRALMDELGGKLPSVRKYMRFKEKMDTLRNHWHAETDKKAQAWRKLISKDKPANERLMELMHDSTIEQIDPSMPYVSPAMPRDPELVRKYGLRHKTGQEAQSRIDEDLEKRAIYADLRDRFDQLPPAFKKTYITVRDAYTELGDAFEKAIEENAEKAMTVAVRRAERAHKKKMDEIRDDGLTGRARAEAIAAADAELKTAKMMNAWSKKARLNSLRARFESNRLSGPYFPLARFGDFYVTLRDKGGKVLSFSRFEKASDQRKFAAEKRAEGYAVETGVVKEMSARSAVDPGFVADVESLLDEINADEQVMDEIWQRWLHTLPDMSLRLNKLHRKGTPGYSADAFRAFGNHMFHGAHQLARLKYSLDMGEALDVAEQEARESDTPERAGLIVKEIERRHEYIMNPKGSAWAQAMTSAAFVYYLSMTPAAALVNLTQTTVVGIPILGAFHGKGGTKIAARELTRAMHDFTKGKGAAERSKRLTLDEWKAMQAAYDRGTIDKSQAHDLAGVGETGVEYSPVRTKVMGAISWFFHHAERANREVTFLAGYRMARAKGLGHESAVQKAADLTWKAHFDYQNTSRPRLLQNDFTRVAMVFRNFQINMLWRLFRDTHQMLRGESPAVRAEARRQLTGISAQMLLQAGFKGVWGYSILMSLIGLFFPGGSDDAEKEMEKALLAFLPRDVVGAFLNGVPGHLLGIDLRSRIGMPDLWFRSPDRQLEGEDEYNYWVQQILGAVPGMAQNILRGVNQIGEGNVWRGTETIVPKAIRDVMRSGRYLAEGARTYNEDPIIEHFKPGEIIAQAIGFTPARLSERYDANTRLKNEERRIIDRRRAIMKEAGMGALKGRGIPEKVLRDIREFNEANPDYPITNKSLRSSIRGRANASARNEFGAQLNPKLNRRLRDDAAPLIYSDEE